MSLFTDLYDAHLTIGGHAITWREIVGNGFGLASAIGGMRRKRVGLAGRHRRQRAAVHGVLLHRGLRRPRRPAARPGRPAGVLHRRVGLRLVALAAEQGAAASSAPAVVAALGDRPGAGGVPRRLGRRGRRLLRGVHADHRRLPGRVVVLPGRRLDLRRVDARDVRHGPRLGRLLADLDRGRPRRRTAAAALALLPVGGAVRRSTAPSCVWGFVTWLRIARTEGEPVGGTAPRPDEVPA